MGQLALRKMRRRSPHIVQRWLMALRFGKTWSARTAPLATIAVVLAAGALFTTQAEARHWRHYYHAYARRQAAPAPTPSAFAAIVVDENSGRTLYAASENELRHPASLTKVMTLYLLFEQL